MNTSESARHENMLNALSAQKAAITSLIERADRNGWNAAINACREILPPEYSIRLRTLYKGPANGQSTEVKT